MSVGGTGVARPPLYKFSAHAPSQTSGGLLNCLEVPRCATVPIVHDESPLQKFQRVMHGPICNC